MAQGDATWTMYERMRVLLAARIGRDLARDTGLSDPDLQVLTALSCAQHGVLRAMSLRCALGWEKSRLSHQLRRMEERGLIARAECTEDGRAAIVHLTDTGRTAVAQAAHCHRSAVQRWFADALTAAQMGQLQDISAAILSGLDPAPAAPHGDG